MIKDSLGIIYHPVLHKIRKSSILQFVKLNKMIKKSVKTELRKSRLYVDITQVYLNDKGTGIQRVSKEIAKRLITYTQKYDVICIFNDSFAGYFSCKTKAPITFSRGDILFLLDDIVSYVKIYNNLYLYLMKNEISVFCFFHDLIPIRFPELVTERSKEKFEFYLHKIVNYTGIICNSKFTAYDLRTWLNENTPRCLKRNENLLIDYSLLGADFAVKTTFANNQKADKIIFLMVATVEPKKKYDQAVKAFDILWQKGYDINLTIVGIKGWKAEETFVLIENNSEYNKRLLWYNTGISDEELAALYQKSTAVIMASITEGFGLSVAEAAQFKKPLIIRDIPPFREIAGENAFYFEGFKAQDLAAAIEKWLELYKNGSQPDSAKIKLRTWDDCTKDVYEILTNGNSGAKE